MSAYREPSERPDYSAPLRPWRKVLGPPLSALLFALAAAVLAIGVAGAVALWRYYPAATKPTPPCVDENPGMGDCSHPDQRMTLVGDRALCLCKRDSQFPESK